MSDKPKSFIILDGNALLHRAWHALPPLTTKDGIVVHAAYGFTMTVEKMLERFNPEYMAVAWDLPGGTFRHEAFKEYKANREKRPDELYAQIEIIQDLLKHYNIPSLSVAGMEADDVIGTIAKKFGCKSDLMVQIVTGDLDSLQLVKDGQAEVIFFVKGVSQTKTYDEAAVMERYELRTDQLIDLKAMMGDSSDNLPGITGVGAKTATTLLKEYDTLEGIYAAIEKGDVVEKFAKKFRGQEELAQQMKFLVTIVLDVDLGGFKLSDAKVKKPDAEALVARFRDLEFRNLLKKYAARGLVAEKEVEEEPEAVVEPKKKKTKKAATVKLSELDGKKLCVHLLAGQQDLFGGAGASLAVSDGKKVSVVSVSDGEKVIKVLDSAELIVGHDLKAVMHELSWSPDTTTLFDTMVAAYLLDSAARKFELETLVQEYLKETVDLTDAIDCTKKIWDLHRDFVDIIDEEKLEKIAYEVEMPLIPVLYRMERVGIMLDEKKLSEMSVRFAGEIAELTEKIHKLAGREFNINSPAQLSDILFEDLGLPTKKIKKTKKSFSTAASELEKLWEAHEIIPFISKYREIAKLKSTYVDALPVLRKEDGRIHTSFNQTVAATGRLSSSEPNLQNIPTRTELGREIRKAFVAPKGKTLIAIDYSQFELRIAAVLADDKAFIDAFKAGADIHRRVSAQILDKPEEEVTKEERSAAKGVNFGILYGMGSRNLAKSSGLSKEEAKIFIARYFDLHPGIANYIEETKKRAHEFEFVETLFGRRRHLPEINGGIGMLVAAAERMAVNMPIQGTQADLIKMAMLVVEKWTRDHVDVELLLQVHDELVFEVNASKVDEIVPELRSMMEGIWNSEVPLLVDVEIGNNWGEMK
ncbi:DNA polymerase I [Candidatus Uhrbacteria bacterium]|jgi:DNA polymerase I|nr:DNA polymerase I [Candidatus Uhrbacteria bacterium]